MSPVPATKIFRFGVYEARSDTGELRKSGVRVRLQDQPFQVLLLLLEHQGEVVTREELRQHLWPSDTFVDFDHSLNTIVNKIREVLGDSASHPRFIETLARRGYRFLQAVEIEQAKPEIALPQPPEPVRNSGNLLTGKDDLPQVGRGYVRFLLVLIQLMYLCFYIAALARASAVQDLLEQAFGHPALVTAIFLVTAAVGVPVRLYLLTAVAFDVRNLAQRFLRLFWPTFVLDELWALSPFLLSVQIGMGLALAATAALIYVPFAQRTLVLMREHTPAMEVHGQGPS
ncbi:MAG TPA: winged helix-turn-helix domain-containing protein [Terriglobales bacterium]|nr:winged helix-turn-helix domain-containing protein [Terriglobales bacterium]